MNILKRRISLVMFVVMLALAVLPVMMVNAASTINYTVKMDSKTLTAGNTYTVEGGERINFTTSSSDVNVSLVGYTFDGKNVTQVNASSASFTVPTGAPGSTIELKVSAAGLNGNNEVIKGSWQTYTLKYASAAELDISLTVKYGSQVLENMKTAKIDAGKKITISANTPSDVKDIYFAWDKDPLMLVPGVTSYSLDIPSQFKEGEEHYLYVKAKGTDGVLGKDFQAYKLILKETTPQVSMVVTLNGKTINPNGTYTVKGGETIKAVASSSKSTIDFIGYYYGDNKNVVDQNGNTLTITVPTGEAGSTRALYIEAVAANDDGSVNTITKTGWTLFNLKYEDNETPVVTSKEVNVYYKSKVLVPNSNTTASQGESIKITATPADKVLKLYYKWDNDSWSVVNSTADYATRIPTSFADGSTHWLYVKAEYTDGTVASQRAYKFTMPVNTSDVTMNVKLDSRTMTAGNSYEVEGGETVTVTATSKNSTIDYIRYKFSIDNNYKTVYSSKATFEVPDRAIGSTIRLYVEAVAKNGATTGEKSYTLRFVETPSGKLSVEPWMEENDEITNLAINLRNDSLEEDKANKNIYALDEVVTYYIDYKNGSDDDIKSEVSIKLELPLAFDVVSSAGGNVNKDDKTIVWTFPNGLKEDESGTLVVKVKYTKFSKSRYDSEMIYPLAAIYQGKKMKDDSAVINLIIKDYNTEIKTEHEPYMYGDANATTFRPNDSITRAEGALVLARIYGLDYENTRITYVFSDIDETYPEAQKAIIAATKAHLINGYTDGTFRPNNKMTRAEFMKILACMIEMNADAEGINGLEIKDVEDLIKVYADSTRYYIVDGKRVYSHWALEEVTFLARLNMTPLSEDDDEIELDESITRAEVAQLVNFYLLRAPASITSRTTINFSDVTKRHPLVGDIVEATRKAHTFSMDDDDGTEIAK